MGEERTLFECSTAPPVLYTEEKYPRSSYHPAVLERHLNISEGYPDER